MFKISTIQKHSPLYALPNVASPHQSAFSVCAGVLRKNQ